MPAKILIVEDHNAVRRALRDWLKVEFPGHKFREATCGEDAINMIDLDTPDLVVMDMLLPGMNGIDTTRMIRAARQSMKIVILATHEDHIYREAAQNAGVSAYVPKHEILAELIPTMNKLLDNGAK
jgi:NarL family two-component system response regulator LiaR